MWRCHYGLVSLIWAGVSGIMGIGSGGSVGLLVAKILQAYKIIRGYKIWFKRSKIPPTSHNIIVLYANQFGTSYEHTSKVQSPRTACTLLIYKK